VLELGVAESREKNTRKRRKPKTSEKFGATYMSNYTGKRQDDQ